MRWLDRPTEVSPTVGDGSAVAPGDPAPGGAGGPARRGRARPGDRLVFVDNLRACLTVLVILHHIAVTYGWSVGWYVHDPAGPGPVGDVLSAFVLLTQAFFMGAFFLIAAYFIPGSYERRGERSFVLERLRRLLIPLLVFRFLIGPATTMAVWWRLYDAPPGWSNYRASINSGPLWFAELLLVLSAGWVIWRRFRPERLPAIPWRSRAPSGRTVAVFVALLGLVTFVWRVWLPVFSYLPVVDFPTPAFLPQYVALFVVGLIAYRRDWFVTVPARRGVEAATGSLVATVTLLPLSMTGGGDAWQGRGTWQSLLFASWEAVFSVGVCIALLTWFRARWATQGPAMRRMTDESFAVYVLHAPVLVAVALLLLPLGLATPVKVAIAVAVGVPACYAVARAARSFPVVRRVL